MNILQKINRIQWKYVMGANLTAVILAGVFATMQPAVSPTDNRSNAKEPVATSLPVISIDLANPPQLLATDPDWAKIGDAIVVKGRNLGRVPFGTLYVGDTEVPHGNIIEWTPDQIVFTVPANSTSDTIKLQVFDTNGKSLSLSTVNILTIRATNK